MSLKKANDVMEELMRSGFSMTAREFYKTTIEKILKKYQIKTKLTEEEYRKLLELILESCAENDLKNMGISFDDWEDK